MNNPKRIATKYWVGTSGWAYPEWLNLFYPNHYPRDHWLAYYATHFNSVEINTTFYRSLPDSSYQRWYQQSPSGFHFVVKASRFITQRHLNDVSASIQRAEKSAMTLNEKLGLILLQLPPTMPYDLARLETSLAAFKHPDKVVVEFRHNQWLTEETKALLLKYGAVFCNVDSPKLKINGWLTADIGYIRLHGHKKMFCSGYSKQQLQTIANHAKQLSQQGAREVYIFFNNTVLGHAFKNAQSLMQLLEVF